MHVSGHSGIGYEFFPPFSNPIGISIGIPIGNFLKGQTPFTRYLQSLKTVRNSYV